VVNSEDHRPWNGHPILMASGSTRWPTARYVDFVIAFDGDVVSQRVNRTDLFELTEIHATDSPRPHLLDAGRPESARVNPLSKGQRKAPEGVVESAPGPVPRAFRAASRRVQALS